jgi:hypothetical protein
MSGPAKLGGSGNIGVRAECGIEKMRRVRSDLECGGRRLGVGKVSADRLCAVRSVAAPVLAPPSPGALAHGLLCGR